MYNNIIYRCTYIFWITFVIKACGNGSVGDDIIMRRLKRKYPLDK